MGVDKKSHNYNLVLVIIGLISVVIFTLQNTEVVAVRFLFWKIEMSRVILILIVFLTGMLLGYLLHGHRNKSNITPEK